MEPFLEPFHIVDATPEDYEAIYKMFSSGKVEYFGVSKRKDSTAEIFFKHYVTHRLMVQRNKDDPNLIGYAEMTNVPNIPALPEDCWMDWLAKHYCHQLPLSTVNTFFFNTFIYNKDYNPDLMRQVLCELFYRENKIRYVIVAQCPDYGFKNADDCPNYYCLEQFSTTYYPNCFRAISCPNTQQIHVIYRDDVVPKMRYRRALPEDNDDIVELVNSDRPDIKQQLGEFYIAEELLSETSNSLLVVTEIFHTTAGFIWLNGNADITPLVENYDLSAYGNLIKFNPDEKFEQKQFVVRTAQRRPINRLFTNEDINAIMESLAQEFPHRLESINSQSPHSEETLQVVKTDDITKRQLFFKKLKKFVETLTTYDYYIQLRQQHYGVFYNIPRDQQTSDFDVQSNVFVIQLFDLMKSHDLRRLFRYLYTAFAAFPDRDYCIMSVSVAQTMTPALFEMLKYFIRIIPRPGCKIDEHLYITHRSAVYGDLTLHPDHQEDIEDIKRLIWGRTSKAEMPAPQRTRNSRFLPIATRMRGTSFATSPSEISMGSTEAVKDQAQYDLQVVMDILKNIFREPFSNYKCFVIKCGDSTKPRKDNVTVGFVILRTFTSSWQLKKHFLLPPVKESPTLNAAEIMIVKLHPLFHYQADVIFRELARQANSWHFYHFQPTLHNCLSNDLLMNMQPLEPRRIKKRWFCQPSSTEFNESFLGTFPANFQTSSSKELNLHPIDFFHDHFAAYQHNVCHSVYFGHTMNIVIIGFTDICKAFLRLMLFSWHGMGNVQMASNCLPHVMITVICSPGQMEAEYESSFRCDCCKIDEDCWVNYRNCDAFVRDVTERLDVRNWVRFVSGEVKAIDKDNHLVKLETNCEIYYETLLLMCSTEYGVPREMFETESSRPSNYIQINDRFDKILFYQRLRMFHREFSSPSESQSFVVYGSHVRAFEFINFLVKHGVHGSAIHLVMPHEVAHKEMGLMLNDASMDTRIEDILREMIEDLGTLVYERMNLMEINCEAHNGSVESVTFQSFVGEQKLTLPCDFFVSYCEKYIADDMLEVIEDSELHTKGSYIFVNENYQTSDPCVYAMGNFIKHRMEPNHQYRFVSPQEAAEKIIMALGLNELQTFVQEEKFSKPYYFQAQLPLDHYFVKVTMPKRYLANHLDNEYGFPLVTHFNGNFTRVRLNEHGMVEEIVAVTRKNKDYDFLKFFCGRHELLLNNLKSRWYLGDIVNFLDFFQEPWTELLMNDNFGQLQMLNKLSIMPTAQKVMQLDTDRESRRKIMRSYCQDLGITGQLEFALLQFIRKNRTEFSTEIALPEDFATAKKEFDCQN